MKIPKDEGRASADPLTKKWADELDSALEREKTWRKEGKHCVRLYECAEPEKNPFNILYSNTETLLPALYNNTPRPVINRRFKDADPLGKMVSRIGQRSLEYLLDPANNFYAPFDNLIEQAILEALVPGRGVTRFKYDAEFRRVEKEVAETPDAEGEGEEQVSYETVCGESIPWDRFRHGYAKNWEEVQWIAFEHFMTREELVKNFGEVGRIVPLNISGNPEGREKEEEACIENGDGVTLAQVFEIWDKETKKVYFLAPSYPDAFLKTTEDPLELSGFFPVPCPLQFFAKISSLLPQNLYATYVHQAKELNKITVRITKIVDVLKVRGFYDGTLQGLERVMEAEDNTLVPIDNVAALQQGGSLDKSIWLMPLEKLIAVLQQLYLQRQQVKTVIYEITGISDILRGSSVASETATAQNIKNQWGTLRLKRMQKLVATYVRECLRMMAEIAMTKLSQETLQGMTGLRFPSAAEKMQIQQLLAQNPQQPPPKEFEAILTLPSWDEISAILEDDFQRNYRIDIETNSTVDAEATEDKENMGEFLNAIAQFMNGVAPMVQTGVMPFEAAQSILLAVTRRYRFGPEVEDELAKMQPPAPAGGEAGAAGEAEAAMAKQEMEAQAAKLQAETQLMQNETQMNMQRLAMEDAYAKQELEFKMRDLQRKEELSKLQFEMKMRELSRPQPAPQPQQPKKKG